MSLQFLQGEENARKLLPGVGILEYYQYVSWKLTNEELTLDVIWGKFEEFCKPQSNGVRARFDLLTSFWQGERSVDEWYNAVQTQVALTRYPQETARILHKDIFCFFPEK